MIDEMIGKGLPVWLPHGEILKSEIERYAVETEEAWVSKSYNSSFAKGRIVFNAVVTFSLCRWYNSPMEMDDGTYYLKAMNCPIPPCFPK